MSKSADRSRTLEYLNLFGYIAFVVLNLLSNILMYGGVTTAQVSDYYANLFAPAGLTFSIWGAIYILLGVFTVYQAKGYKPELTAKISYWFLLSCIANVVWLFLWQYFQIPLTMLVMVALFLCLLVIYLRLGSYTRFDKENLIMRVPFSVYLGWISVATIGNVTTLLVYLDLSLRNPTVSAFGLAQDLWAVLIIVVAIVLCLAVLFTRKDIAYSLVFVWALLGILIKRMSDYIDVAAAASVGIVVILISMTIIWLRYWRAAGKGAKTRNK